MKISQTCQSLIEKGLALGVNFKSGTVRLGNWRASDSESKPFTETSTRAGRPLVLERRYGRVGNSSCIET